MLHLYLRKCSKAKKNFNRKEDGSKHHLNIATIKYIVRDKTQLKLIFLYEFSLYYIVPAE